MKTLVIYDSIFGNTEKVALEIGKILEQIGEVNTIRVTDFNMKLLDGLDMIIVGSPTRAFSATPEIKKFIANIPKNALKNVRVTSFDTRMSMNDVNSAILPVFVKVFGYAAEPIAKKLVGKGGKLIIHPEGFFVSGSEGPLKDGELMRAAVWSNSIIEICRIK